MVNPHRIDFENEIDPLSVFQPENVAAPRQDGPERKPNHVHLATLMMNVCSRTSKKLSRKGGIDMRKGFVLDVCFLLGKLWESARHEAWWNDVGHITLGVIMRGKSARSRRISPAFKKSIVTEVRNNRMKGIRSTKQLMIGMQVGNKRGPVSRLNLALRRSARKIKEKGQASGRSYDAMVSYNYYLDSRSQTHV